MTELESKLLMADAVVDIIKTCESKQKEFRIDKIIAQGKNYKITQKYSEYTNDNDIAIVYPSIVRNIPNKDEGE